jgi:activator of HSP90 ATPase
MKNGFKMSVTLDASAQQIYDAWMSTDGHSTMTGSAAQVDPKIGGAFSAWDGYIFGKTLELEAPRRIVQAWRTTEFSEDAVDSRLEVLLEEKNGKTKLTLLHSNLPEDQADSYKVGWKDFYFKPMKEYFSS